MKKVLVTGASGFVGRHTLEILEAKGYEVHAISSQKALQGNQAHWHVLDLFNSSRVDQLMERLKPSHLLHLAWITEPGVYWESSRNWEWLQASIHLLHSFSRCGGKRALFSGSCAEYDWNSSSELDEKRSLFNPATFYGASKRSLFLLCKEIAKREDLSFAWGYLFFLFGEYERAERFVPSILKGLIKREPISCSLGTQIRDFLYVKDAAHALVFLLDSSLEGGVNIASGNPIPIKDLALQFARMMDGENLLKFGALPMNKKEPERLIANVSRLKSELGWAPRYSFEKASEEVLSWAKMSL